MPELQCAAWHLHKWFSPPFMLPVNYVYAFGEVIRENRHNREPEQPAWDGIYHMATAAGGAEPTAADYPTISTWRCSPIWILVILNGRPHGHSSPCGLPSHRHVSSPDMLFGTGENVRRCNVLKGPGCKTQLHLAAMKNIAISHLQYLEIPERLACVLSIPGATVLPAPHNWNCSLYEYRCVEK